MGLRSTITSNRGATVVLCSLMVLMPEMAFAQVSSMENGAIGSWFSSLYEAAYFAFAIIMLGVAALLAVFYVRDSSRWK